MKILLAEDTRDLNRVLTVALQNEGYDVDSAFDGEEAYELIRNNGYDATILDIMMPKKDGIEVLTDIRNEHVVTPVLLLTAKSEIDDRVLGLDAGADDYLTKPFAMKELLARVRAMVRRKEKYDDQGAVKAKNMEFGDLKLDAGTFELSSENSVRLSVKEFELLSLLINNAENEVDSALILKNVWDGSPGANEDTVWLYVMYLRGKLRSIASKVVIDGERGQWYRLKMNG